MNILLINYEYPPIGAGASNATWYIAQHMKTLGCKTVVLTSRYRHLLGRKREEHVTVYRSPALRKHREQSDIIEMGSFLLSASAMIPYILRKEKINGIIVFFSLPCGPLGLLCKYLSKVPYILSLRGGDVPGNEISLNRLHQLLRPMRWSVMKNSAGIVANSSGLKALSEKADPFPVHIIPNGVDTEYFKPKPHKNSSFRFLFVGRFQAQKNLFFLLQQTDQLAGNINVPFEVHLVGDGPQRKDLLSYVNSLRIKDRVRWHGWRGRENIRVHYQKADCLLNPSLWEGLPNVLLEGMACGLPVIASKVIGNEEVVKMGETGFLFDLNKPEIFQNYLLTILERPELAKQLGANGRKLVEKEFSWNMVAEDYLKLLMKEGSSAV